MSLLWKNKGNNKKTTEIQKNSRAYYSNSIEYNKEGKNSELFERMKNGYIEMAQLNLQMASESEIFDINNYETWLSGVWFVKWRLW